jgi:ATP phosphoribosyltransferase regulatory subunit
VGLPTEETVPAEAMAAIRAPFEAFGGVRIDPDLLQPLGLLLDLAGEAMRPRLLVVESEGVEPSALRPDFTIPVAQAHIASGAARGRYVYEGKAFRVAQAGSGRPAEFLQIGAELYGPSTDEVGDDVALTALAWAAARAGGRDDLSIRMGDVGLFDAFVRAIGAPDGVAQRLTRAFADGRSVEAEIARAEGPAPAAPAGSGRLAGLLTDLPEAEGAAVLEELWRLAGIQPVGGRSPDEIVHRLIARSAGERGPRLSAAEAGLIRRYLALAGPPRAVLDQIESLAYEAKAEFSLGVEPWVRRLKGLAAAGIPEAALTLAAGFARPFGYYDGMLFEVRSAALGADRPVAAGGRYDGLTARLGGNGEPGAVGCIVRPARAWAGASA